MVQTVSQKLDAAARKFPSNEVLISPERAMSWGELDLRAGAVARSLVEKGLRPGDRLAITMEDIVDNVIGILAGLKVGAAIAPINPRLSANEKSTILKVLKTNQVLDELPTGNEEFLSLKVDDETPSIILFTSGSTGEPKGVVLSQRAVTAGMEVWIKFALQLRPSDGVISVLPLAHSYGLFGTLLAPLLLSATSILVPRVSPEDVIMSIEKNKATVFSGVATMFRRMLDSGLIKDADLSSLRFCTSGAAPCPWSLAEEWREATGIKIVRGYGMSELFRPICYSPDDSHEIPESIGRAPDNVKMRLVDEDENVIDRDPNSVGELWIHSPTCMTEYVDRPEDTKAVLEGGWFKTGDLARITNEGMVCIVGRKKEVILRGGYTIAAGEVEAVLVSHPNVAEAAVIAVPDRELGEEICAYVACRPGMTIDEEEMVEYCKDLLSSYKYPRKIYFVDELPKNTTGKIDKTQLSS